MKSGATSSRRRILLTVLLGTYILLQFSWWAWLLIQQQSDLHLIQTGSETWSRKNTMILGEGIVFLSLLTFGFVAIWRGLQRENIQARKERNLLLAVTHELKTPIAAVQLAIETLQKHEVDPATSQSLLAEAQSGAQRLLQRIENILQSNRMVTGGALNEEAFDAEEVMQDAIRRNRTGRFQDRVIELHLEGNSTGLMDGDPDALGLAWGNLVENALKYSPDIAPINITMTWQPSVLTCRIEDGGPGIPEAQWRTVLQKFRRLEDAQQLETEGTGLGLYLAHQIIKMHRGSLSIGTNPRRGCTITTSIPCNS